VASVPPTHSTLRVQSNSTQTCLVSTDDAVLQLDGLLTNRRGANILCRDTDSALNLL